MVSCQTSETLPVKKQDGKIPIVTTNETIGIHAKMIAGEKAFVVPLVSVRKIPSASEREIISDSAAILSDFPLSGSILGKTLHKYPGTYLNLQE